VIHVNRPIPKEKIKLLIFDLDGTLVDSRQDLTNSINAMLRHFHRPELGSDIIASYIGDGAPTLVRRSLGFVDHADLKHEQEEFVEEALTYFLDFYREHKLDYTYVYDGVVDALRAIRANGAGHPRVMAVLSNKPVRPSQAIVEALGLKEFFISVYGGNSFETKKPHPLGIQMLLSETSASPGEAVIIGDSYIDVLAARNAGIYSCGVSFGLAPETLVETPPDVIVDTAGEWVEVFC
jgi:phosphoglycolate phosphatase